MATQTTLSRAFIEQALSRQPDSSGPAVWCTVCHGKYAGAEHRALIGFYEAGRRHRPPMSRTYTAEDTEREYVFRTQVQHVAIELHPLIECPGAHDPSLVTWGD